MKTFLVSDSKNGYIFNFVLYFGKEVLILHLPLFKTTQIVTVFSKLVIMKNPDNPTWRLYVYTDRYYTNPGLALGLLK